MGGCRQEPGLLNKYLNNSVHRGESLEIFDFRSKKERMGSTTGKG